MVKEAIKKGYLRRPLSKIKCFNSWSKNKGTAKEAVKKAVKEVIKKVVREAVNRVRGKVLCIIVL